MTWRGGVVANLFQAVEVARKDCLVLLHYRGAVVFVIVMPVVMVVICGLALKGLEGGGAETVVALEDRDHGEVAARFRRALEGQAGAGDGVRFAPEALDPAEARRRVRAGELGGLIVLPEGLSERREKGEDARAELLVGPLQPPERALLEATAGRLAAAAGAAGPALECTVTAEGDPPKAFNSFAQAVAGNGVLFILLNCIMTGGVSLVRERRTHTLDRLMMAPMSRGAIVLGKVMGVYALGLAQAVLLLGFGLVIGVPLGNLAGVILVTLLFILVGCAIGLTVSALAGREDSVQMIGGPVSMLMTALGGGLFPAELAPRWMQTVALLFPTGWAMNAYHQLMWQGKDVAAVLPNLLVLAAFAAVFFLLGVRLLRWE